MNQQHEAAIHCITTYSQPISLLSGDHAHYENYAPPSDYQYHSLLLSPFSLTLSSPLSPLSLPSPPLSFFLYFSPSIFLLVLDCGRFLKVLSHIYPKDVYLFCWLVSWILLRSKCLHHLKSVHLKCQHLYTMD